jgi:hypothetical protein
MRDHAPNSLDRPPFLDGALARSIMEADRLSAAFADTDSLSGLLENLHQADRRDVELVAMLGVARRVLRTIDAAAESEQAADARRLRWLAEAPAGESRGE